MFLLMPFILFLSPSCKTVTDASTGATKVISQEGNSLFHQTKETSLKVGKIEVTGEVKNPGTIRLDALYKREVFVKESVKEGNEIKLIGAYRYSGYSLFDILNPYIQNKKNGEAFKPPIDLYVIIGNAKGESVVFSWSEIFYTNNPHQIIIATESAPIEPHRKKVDFPVGTICKVVAANDLYACRMLENPTTIKVVSFDKKEYPIQKNLNPAYSPDIKVFLNNETSFIIPEVTDSARFIKYNATFYGMGMGYHPVPYFQGPALQDFLKKGIDLYSPDLISHGLVCFVGIDGYRSVYSFSELFNRTDQVLPILSVVKDKMDGGYYRIFLPSVFYADMSVKGLAEIYFFKE